MNASKRTTCKYDGKPCKQADRCTLRLLDALVYFFFGKTLYKEIHGKESKQ